MVKQIRLLWKDSKMIRISLTRHDAPRPQEGDGTIWQLNDGTVEESRTVEHYSHSEKCKAKEIINSPPSGVQAMKSDWTDCSQGAEAVTWLSSWGEKSLHSASERSDDWGQCDCGRFRNSISSHGGVLSCFAFFFDLNSFLLDCRKNGEQVVHPTPQTSVWNPNTNPGSQQSP